jgi:hypothetical protein
VSAKLKTGDFLLKKQGLCVTLRRIGPEADVGFSYLQLAPDYKEAQWGCCSTEALRAWGTPIPEEEAHRLVPNMQAQITRLEQEEKTQGKALINTLEPMLVINVSDATLIAELERRGYRITKY